MSDVFNKNPEQHGEGGYVFLSHSHDDIKIVRQYRNILEENGMEPLCFFLKCLNDDTEVFDLIKREIDARKQFVFIESENSKKSKWVSREREYVRQCPDKIIHTVTLDEILSSPQEAADKLLYSMRVYISYRKRDFHAASAIFKELEKQDFQVWYDDFLTNVYSMDELTAKIREACEYGAVVLILNERSLEPNCYQMKYEYPFAMREGGFVIPVWIGSIPWDEIKDRFYLEYPNLDTTAVIDGSRSILLAAKKIIETIQRHQILG